MLPKHCLDQGVPQSDLARRFGINRTTIWRRVRTRQRDSRSRNGITLAEGSILDTGWQPSQGDCRLTPTEPGMLCFTERAEARKSDMTPTQLEHVNLTVSDPKATAAWIERVFGWKTRWEGTAMETGYTVHVGSDDSYVALFAHGDGASESKSSSYMTKGGLNHWAVVVEDLDATEERVKAEGFNPVNHADYVPGRRFYFHDNDGIEVEVVQYD